MLLCGAIAWAAYMCTQSLPYWPINPSIATEPLVQLPARSRPLLWAVLPAAILWGASFPLALASVASRRQDPARLVGGVYAANTVGAIVGSLGVEPAAGRRGSAASAPQQVLIIVSGLSALLVLEAVPATQDGRPRRSSPARSRSSRPPCAPRLLARNVPPDSAAARRLRPLRGDAASARPTSSTVGEGWNASVAVSRLPSGVLNYHNAGKVQASSEPQDMRLQRMLGHMTTLIPTNPKRVLVIGCGAGVTAGAVSIDPSVEQLTIAEIEPLVPRVVSTYFAEHNFDVVENPKTHVHLDDARHYLLTTNEKFDAITSDPLDPWVKGAAMLYTREFFELAKAHLNPGGVVTLFVQLYESNTEAVKSEIATFLEAFPNGVVWGNTQNGARLRPRAARPGSSRRRSTSTRSSSGCSVPSTRRSRLSLSEIGMNSAVDLFSTYAGTATDLQPWLKDASINRDRNLRLQYLAGLGLNLYQSESIYADMLAYASGIRTICSSASDATKTALQAQAIRRDAGEVAHRARQASERHSTGRVDDPAVEQIDVPLRPGDVVGVVGRQADGGAVGVQLAEHLHQRVAALRIEIAGRLVGEQDRRPAGDRARDGDELLVTA